MTATHILIAGFAALAMISCNRGKPTHAGTTTPAAPTPVATSPAPAPVAMEAFTKAALDGDLAIVKQALAAPAAANYADPDGRTALMLAAFNGHSGIVAALLDAGAKIDTRDQTGRTALMYACSGSNDATVALLVKRRAGVNLADSEEHWTPLMFAAAEGQTEVARRLLAAGADPTAADIDGEDSALFARSKGFAELADLIAKAKERAKAAPKPPASPP
jgi:uncharacterized protein